MLQTIYFPGPITNRLPVPCVLMPTLPCVMRKRKLNCFWFEISFFYWSFSSDTMAVKGLNQVAVNLKLTQGWYSTHLPSCWVIQRLREKGIILTTQLSNLFLFGDSSCCLLWVCDRFVAVPDALYQVHFSFCKVEIIIIMVLLYTAYPMAHGTLLWKKLSLLIG